MCLWPILVTTEWCSMSTSCIHWTKLYYHWNILNIFVMCLVFSLHHMSTATPSTHLFTTWVLGILARSEQIPDFIFLWQIIVLSKCCLKPASPAHYTSHASVLHALKLLIETSVCPGKKKRMIKNTLKLKNQLVFSIQTIRVFVCTRSHCTASTAVIS